jgi:hypothetical protein
MPALMTIPDTSIPISTIKLVAFTGARFLNEFSCPLGNKLPDQMHEPAPPGRAASPTHLSTSIRKTDASETEQQCSAVTSAAATLDTANCRDAPADRAGLPAIHAAQRHICTHPELNVPPMDAPPTSDTTANEPSAQSAPKVFIEDSKMQQLSSSPEASVMHMQAESGQVGTDSARTDTSRVGSGADTLVDIMRGNTPAHLSPRQVLDLVNAAQLYMADAVLAALPLYLAPILETGHLMLVRYLWWCHKCRVAVVWIFAKTPNSCIPAQPEPPSPGASCCNMFGNTGMQIQIQT